MNHLYFCLLTLLEFTSLSCANLVVVCFSSGQTAKRWYAICHRYVTADAMGMAKVRGRREEEDVDGAGIGLGTSTVPDTMMYPGSGLSGEITPLLLLVSCISMELSYNNGFSIYSGERESR